MAVLSAVGVSIAAMRFAGGMIALLVALAMVLAKEESLTSSPP